MSDYLAVVWHKNGAEKRFRLRCDDAEGWALKESMAALWAAGDIVNASIGDPPEPGAPTVKDDIWLDTVDHRGVKAKPSAKDRVDIATRIVTQKAKHGVA